MSPVTSYSDARKELERITSQRKHFFNISKSLRDENMSNLKQDHSRFSTPSSSNRPISVPIDYQTNYRASSSTSMNNLNSLRQSPDKTNNLHTHASHNKIHQGDASSSLGLGSASSVIGAFRQLQAKSRIVEQERADAFKERDDLQSQMLKQSQAQNFGRNQSEMQHSESFLKIESAREQLEASRRDLELKILTFQELIASTQRSNSNDRGIFLTLQADISNMRDTLHSLKGTNRGLEGELTNSNKRNSRIDFHKDQSSGERCKQSGYLENSISNATEHIAKGNKANCLSKIRCDDLQRYMELILKINGDLSRRIADTVSARAHMRNITERLIPPHYAWPKELSYDCIQNIVSEAAAEKLKEGNETHSQTPSKISKDILDGGHDALDMGHINLNLDNNWERGGFNVNSNCDVDYGRIKTEIVREEESVLERERRNTFDLDAAYRALSTDPNRRRARSSHSKGTIHSQQVKGKGASLSSSPSKGSRVGFRYKGSRSVSAPRVRDSEKFISGANFLESSSPYRTRPPVSYMVLDKHDSAYNQAVSAAAASVLAGLGGGGGGGALEGSRTGFIPGGNTEGKEFNVFAKGSKIARATAHFNAAVAARVKAYKKNLMGDDLLNIVMGGTSRD
jgi:hypothetical protein